MHIEISPNGIRVETRSASVRNKRQKKGKSLLCLPIDYCIIDIETTGLSPEWNEIIEISSLKCINGKCVDSFSELVKPLNELDDFIESLTGITNEMVENADPIQNVLPRFLDFIGDTILIAHNANFDINFLYDNYEFHLNRPLSNDFVDTMRIFRKLHPELSHHRLQDLAEYYCEEYRDAHRSLNDCQILKKCYDKMIEEVASLYGSTDVFSTKLTQYKKAVKSSDIITTKLDFDTSHPLYNKVVVFTGTLECMVRKDAMQIVADLGGINGDSVTKKTNYLVLGNNDYCRSIKDGKSAKHKKAEALKISGNDIEIISESVFYDLITDFFEDNSCGLFEDKKASSTLHFYDKLEELLEEIILEKELPESSLHIYSNISRTTKDETSKSICIYEPEFPEMKRNTNDPKRNFVVMNIKDREHLELLIRKTQFSHITLPSTATIKEILSDENFTHVIFKKDDQNIFDYIKQNIYYCLKYYESKAKTFGCCNKFIQCSDAKKCVHENKLYSMACSYRHSLDSGRIFYGKNRNVD